MSPRAAAMMRSLACSARPLVAPVSLTMQCSGTRALTLQKLFLFPKLLRPSRVAAGRYQFHVAPTLSLAVRQAGWLSTAHARTSSAERRRRRPTQTPSLGCSARQPTPTATSSDLSLAAETQTLAAAARSIN
jgi:hypothetical protein